MSARVPTLIAAAALFVSAGAARAQVPVDTAHHLQVNAMLLTPGQYVYQMRLVRDSIRVPKPDSTPQHDTLFHRDSVANPAVVPKTAAGVRRDTSTTRGTPPTRDSTQRTDTLAHRDSIWVHDSLSVPIGGRTVSAEEATYQGSPAWLLLETRTTERGSATDSLLVRRDDLRPLHWGATLGPARLSAEFVADTALFGATSGPTGRRSVVANVPAGALVSASMLETMLRLLPLQAGWHDSTVSVSITLGSDLLLPTTLSVIRQETVSVPGGIFDCWVVDARAAGAETLYWVSKQNPAVVRSIQAPPNMGGARLVTELTRVLP